MDADKTIYVPEPKFKEMIRKGSASSICDSGTCQTVMWQNQEYITTGGLSKGMERIYVSGNVVENHSTYTGKLKPLRYHAHFEEVDAGKRDREYTGMLLKCGDRQLVVVGERVQFKLLRVGQQLNLF